MVALAGIVSGCATTGTSNGAGEDGEQQRRIPPEVTDHTVHEVEGETTRPSVDVDMQFDGMRGVDRQSIETRVSQQTVRCYRAALQDGPGFDGSMVYEIVVMRSGFVVGSDVLSTAINDRNMQACVERSFERLRFNIGTAKRPVYRVMVQLDFSRETVLPEESPVQAEDAKTD